jgi:hypothetical protein
VYVVDYILVFFYFFKKFKIPISQKFEKRAPGSLGTKAIFRLLINLFLHLWLLPGSPFHSLPPSLGGAHVNARDLAKL